MRARAVETKLNGIKDRGLRPGTLPVPQIVGFGVAASLAEKQHSIWSKVNSNFKLELKAHLASLKPVYNGDQEAVMSHCLSMAFPGIDSESLIVALKGVISISNGSACTSASYKSSHVLEAMGLTPQVIAGTIRLSWCHLTPKVDWPTVVEKIKRLRSFA